MPRTIPKMCLVLSLMLGVTAAFAAQGRAHHALPDAASSHASQHVAGDDAQPVVTSGASYDPASDVFHVVTTGDASRASDVLDFGKVNDTLATAQQTMHDTVYWATGTSVDWYYIWISIDGNLLRVDPFTFNR